MRSCLKKVKTMEKESMHGGRRPGAGRKKITGEDKKKAVQFYITDAEKALLKNYLELLRSSHKEKKDSMAR